ncbi:enoyl-CoA hydratase-related protein [Zhongshania aquimaris]|uniref:Enoyl-CoA hydratase/isomerase family protein n=1 Tax=Zhongshania aquimaris TaxID=2857107 RepID=A0ABS6VW64_9GAMM|nr:enoyl-CoA hydratase-related protein [Zhongshania aquimaris]MBW2942248.1 enoyl-CoA hydratase/isomerase family protein [Zhongshania aquimaris]
MNNEAEFKSFKFNVENMVAHIVLSSPEKRNCLTRDFWRELPLAVKYAESRGDIRCILIRADGAMFSAGIDLALLDSLKVLGSELDVSRRADYLRRTILSVQNSISCLEQTPIPVVAAIQGACIGGALDLVCAADIRLVEIGTTLTPLEMDLGFVPDLGTVQRLTSTLPYGVVADWLMDCRSLTGSDANSIGFASRIAQSPQELTELAKNLAERIARRSPIAVRGAKEIMKFTKAYGVEASLRYTAAWQSGAFPGDDINECFDARREKRAPTHDMMVDDRSLYGIEDKGRGDIT